MKKHGFNHRILAPLKGRGIPKVMLFTDTETAAETVDFAEIHKFTLGWVFTWESRDEAAAENTVKRFFNDPLKYCRYFEDMARKHKSIVIYGHNIFFDLQCAGFFKYFTDAGWSLDWIYDKGLTYILRIVKDSLKIMALSTTNYFDCSLAELGVMIGVEKQEIEFSKASRRQLKKYCYRDTEVVMHGVWYFLQFIKDNDLGKLALTKSSQSLISYRTRFLDKKICLHGEDASFDLERKAYMGGRTEAFCIGHISGEDFLTLDVNSMYPFVMQKYRYPSKLLCTIEGEKMIRYTEMLGGYGMIAEVDLDTPEPAFAVRYNKKPIFPTGQFRAFLCTQGLRYAVKQGYVKDFIRASIYETEDLFTGYVRYFVALRESYRKAGNTVMVKLCKYMLNCLYGKWGEREILTDTADNHTGIDYLRREIWDGVYGGWWTETYLMNKIVMQHGGGEGFHSFPAIAAHITENARLELWDIIKTIGKDIVLYCDTDSVIIHASDIKKVRTKLDDSEPGALKIQQRFAGLQIDGAKNYRTDEKRHIKGIPESAVETAPGVFRYDSFQRQAACMTDGQITGVKISPVTRRLNHRYDKGQINDDGTVKPYHFTFLESTGEAPSSS
jgi:hypothetical protein